MVLVNNVVDWAEAFVWSAVLRIYQYKTVCVCVFVCPPSKGRFNKGFNGQSFNMTVFTTVYFSGLIKNSKNIFHKRVIMSLPLEM